MIKKPIVSTIVAIFGSLFLSMADGSAVAESGGTVAVRKIVPQEGYAWPEKERLYWPTRGWETAPMELHGIDPEKMALARQLAIDDTYLRSLLVIKDGYLVFEEYFNGGRPEQSTEVWSVTKSFTSALVGIAIDKGQVEDVDDLMLEYLPNYLEFGDMTIRHVLTHTTGLEWTEEGDEFVGWVESEDWIENAVRRERLSVPGEVLHYSSGNSHFLSGLIKAATGKTPGEYAREHIFDPLGIAFEKQKAGSNRRSWDDFLVRTPRTWKQDSKGLEVGAFGLHLTAREMAKFGYLFLNKGRWDNKTILSEKWVEESTRDHVLRTGNFGFGFQWVVSERGGQIAFNADGWGGQIICVIPGLDMVVVMKSDSESPGGHPYYQILARVIEAGVPRPKVTR